jgi:hypothetical protein
MKEQVTPLLNPLGITGVGYFGIPGGYGGQTHAVRGTKPICGQRMDTRAEYQWCSNCYDVMLPECQKCRGAIMRAMESALALAKGKV